MKIHNAGSDSHFAATMGLGVTEIKTADAEEAEAAIRAGQTRVVGKRTQPRFFIGNTVQSIYITRLCGEGEERAEGVAAMVTLHYKIILRKEEDGTYTVIVPSLPGCLNFGHTVEEALEMAKEAIEGFIRCMTMRGGKVPVETGLPPLVT
jgi:predicted RNase H-like HicB family nuclease